MARSLKKGPYVHYKLENKVAANVEANKKTVIKTWSRASMITPDFVGQTIAVPVPFCFFIFLVLPTISPRSLAL